MSPEEDLICDDKPKPIPEDILRMTDEEIEAEYKKRFWRLSGEKTEEAKG